MVNASIRIRTPFPGSWKQFAFLILFEYRHSEDIELGG